MSENGFGNHSTVLTTAQRYVEGGCSVVPIRLDGTKRPAVSEWTWLQERRPTANELDDLFGRRPTGIATICGRASGNLEILDLDDGTLIEEYEAAVEAECPGLINRLCTDETPRNGGGRQYKYRCLELTIPGNQKLALSKPEPVVGEDGCPVVDPATGQQKTAPRTLIETRGEGGYAVAPGSPVAVHKTGRPYRHIRGPSLTELPVITAGEREVLFRVARSFDRFVAYYAPQEGERPAGQRTGLAPGDDFNQGAAWPEILEPHGWKQSGTRGGVTYWTRPGKSPADGHSATTGLQSKAGNDLLCVFSTNAYPFQIPAGKVCESFSKFAAYTLLNHNGDFSAAAKSLADQGYGDKHPQRSEQQAPMTSHTVGAATITPKRSRRTTAKLCVELEISVAGAVVDRLKLSDAYSSRKAVAKEIRCHAGADVADADEAIRKALATILVEASNTVDRLTKASLEGNADCIRDILKREVPSQISLIYATARGAFTQTLGREISKSQFVDRFANNELLGLAHTAADAPTTEDGRINRRALISLFREELALLWGDLTKGLPNEVDATIGADSAPAERLREIVSGTWTRTANMEIVRQVFDGPDKRLESHALCTRASLVSKTKSLMKRQELYGKRDVWHRIQPAYAAWFREEVKPDGEILTLLAMRFELFAQIGVRTEGVATKGTIRRLGERYECFDRAPPKSDRLGDGTRLLVLTRALTDELLAEPDEAAPDYSH